MGCADRWRARIAAACAAAASWGCGESPAPVPPTTDPRLAWEVLAGPADPSGWPSEIRGLLEGADPAGRELQVGAQTRRAYLVPPGGRARARAISPSGDARVALGLAAIGSARGGESAVRVTFLSEDGAPRVQRLELPLAGRWQDAALDLEMAAGEPFEITVELEDAAGAPAALALDPGAVFRPVASPPTVVLVTSDTHRGDHVEGAPRAAALTTPALRELAARGVTFVDCFSTTNVTVPSHVAMLTGLHPRDSGVTDNRTRLSREPVTLAEVFSASGFRTIAVTSLNLLSPQHSNLAQGFDVTAWTQATRRSDKAVEVALRELDEARGRPVFAWIHVFDAHGPYEPPPPFDRAFYGSGRDPSRSGDEAGEATGKIPPYLEGVRDLEYVRALYRGEIGYLDAQLARLLAHPRVATGVVAFTGDHGEVLGRHGIWWAHKDVYPDTLHVPLILAWPGAPAGERRADPVLNVDVGRTLLDLAGLSEAPFPGRDLSGPAAAPAPRFALGGGRWEAAANDGRWHLILQLAADPDDERHDRRERHAVELFDLEDDPGCEHDRSASEREVARALREKLVEWLAGWRGERFAELRHGDPATLRDLAQLGYASGEAPSAAGLLLDPACACAQCARWR